MYEKCCHLLIIAETMSKLADMLEWNRKKPKTK